MKRKPYIIGTLAAGVVFAAALGTPGVSRIVSSAQNFGHYFRAMQTTGSLGPVERFAYSLVLANSQPQQSHK